MMRWLPMCCHKQATVLVWLVLAVVGYSLFRAGSPATAQPQTMESPTGHVVTIEDRGVRRTIVTRVATVGQLLDTIPVQLDTADIVLPALDSPVSQTGGRIVIHRARPVTIVDGLRRVTVTTAQQAPQKIAQAAGIQVYREDTVRFAQPDNLLLDGVSMLLYIQRSPTRTVTVEEEVPFAVTQIRDAARPLGFRQVQRPGRPGRLRLTYQLELEQGRETKRHLLRRQLIRSPQPQQELIGTKPVNPLTKSKGAHRFTDSKGVVHRETYYDLPMNIVMKACGAGGHYTVRGDGAKVDKDGHVIVAANYGNYPRCSVVETSMGPGKVYDTGGFAKVHPHGFDLATDWTNGDGR